MVHRRIPTQELTSVNEPRWLAVTTPTHALIQHMEIPPGADLKAVLVKTLAAYVESGWKLEDFSSNNSSCFINRGADRLMIHIRPTDPTKALPCMYKHPR
jgi:hypothetical protein